MSCSSNDELRIDDVVDVEDAVDKTFECHEAEEVVSSGVSAQSDTALPVTKHLASEVETHPFQ